MVTLLDRNFRKGDRVEVLLNDARGSYFYCGTITDFHNDLIYIKFDNENEEKSFPDACVRRTDGRDAIKYSPERLHNPKYHLG